MMVEHPSLGGCLFSEVDNDGLAHRGGAQPLNRVASLFFDDETKLPLVFNVPIINYFDSQIFCIGHFRKPTQDEIKTHSRLPFAIFVPAESHGWKVSLYSMDEVIGFVKQAKPI